MAQAGVQSYDDGLDTEYREGECDPCQVNLRPVDVELHPPVSVTTSIDADGDVYDTKGDHSNKCGFGKWRPDFLQHVNSPNSLVVCLASYSFALGFLVNGVHNVNVSTIERRFNLSSTTLGFVSSSFDISAAILALFIGYYGSGKRKPRLLASCIFVSAMGSLLMASPHYFSERYSLGTATNQMCAGGSLRHRTPDGLGSSVEIVADSSEYHAEHVFDGGIGQTSNRTKETNNFGCKPNELDGEDNIDNYVYLFFLAQLLHGIGGTALFTVGTSLMDDSVEAVRTPLYIGIIYGSNILGSGTGYILGGQFLSIYVDFDSSEPIPDGLSPDDMRWVGAWWIGPTIAAVLQLAIVLPMSLFGVELPQAREVRRNRINQAHASSLTRHTTVTSRGTSCVSGSEINSSPGKAKQSQFVTSTLEIIQNPCFSFITLTMTTEAMFFSGSAAFLAKIIETEFGIPASRAAIFTGLAVVPAAVFGLIMGGYLAKRYNFTIQDTIKFIMTFCFLGGISCSVLWIHCKPPPIYGVHVAYPQMTSFASDSVDELSHSLQAPCNKDCFCKTNYYEPVCSDTGIFFSPCFAGCSSKQGEDYYDCSCVESNFSALHNTTLMGGQLSSNNCRESCGLLYLFTPLLFIGMCFTFMPVAPCDSLQLRCVAEEHKVYAQGIKTLVVRLLGSFFGPLMMGRLVDLSCWVWREECDGQSLSCWIYNPDHLALSVYLYVTALKVLSVIFSSLALRFYRPPSNSDSLVVRVDVNKARNGSDVTKEDKTTPDQKQVKGEDDEASRMLNMTEAVLSEDTKLNCTDTMM